MSLVPPQLSLNANHLSPASLEPPTPKAWAEPDRGGPSNPYAAYAQTNVNGAMNRLFGSGARPVPDEDWAYERVDNASDCRLLWWLYGAQPPAPREEAPLLVWLEGGPGEIRPSDIHALLEARWGRCHRRFLSPQRALARAACR